MSQHIGPRTVSGTGGSIKRVGNYRIHTFPSEIVTDGLILNLDPGDPDSYPSQGLIWTDLSGMGNNGTMTANDTPTYQTVNGGIFNFDGSNDYVTTSLPNNAIAEGDANSEYTLEAWIYVESSQGGDTNSDAIMGHTTSYGVGMQVGTASSLARVNYGSRSTSNFYGNTFNYNEWRHIVLTRDGISGPIAYENGVEVSRTGNITDLDIGPGQTIGDFNVGYCGPRISGRFHGRMGPVRVYNRALSAAEVAQNYDALKVRYTTYTNTFTPICAGPDGKVEVLCVAGGGGGGTCQLGDGGGGGGGAGGLIYNPSLSLSSNVAVSLSVGSGGAASTSHTSNGNSGNNSAFGSLTAIGGGGGGSTRDSTALSTGGSGGGAGSDGGDNNGGAGTAGQGFAGGNNTTGNNGGGGGGAGEKGSSVANPSPDIGTGGAGLSYSISGSAKYYAGGGGGGQFSGGTGVAGRGGLGGAGDGGKGEVGKSAAPNTGSGGGGGGMISGDSTKQGGNGSNGTVIVRYPATDYNVEVLVVGAGGGGGSNGNNNGSAGGGGGAGEVNYSESYAVIAGKSYMAKIGAGGAGGAGSTVPTSRGENGNVSTFGDLLALGGGGGGGGYDPGTAIGKHDGQVGASGGGGGSNGGTPSSGFCLGGKGIPGKGNDGGNGSDGSGSDGAGGGGGAGAKGGDGVGATATAQGGVGGAGLAYSITGTSVTYAGGGGGGGAVDDSNSGGGDGGTGGGGRGGHHAASGVAGTANTGGGGGGAGTLGTSTIAGSKGGSGVIIIAYKGPQRGTGGTVDTTSRPGYTIHKFTAVGRNIFIP